jgi:predicted MFS family arabinose efflux permease
MVVRNISLTLLVALFAAQSAVIAMSPALAQAATDLHVSIAAAGQLRTITGIAAGITALLLGGIARRIGLRSQLLGASALLGLGSLASAAAPDYTLLSVAQLPVGVAVAVLTTAGTLAAAEWVPEELRTRTLSWALVGQPAAWIVGMPLLGVVDAHNWRYGWLALPLVAAAVAALLLARSGDAVARTAPVRHERSVLRDRAVGSWLASELFANAAWAGTLVYAGALFAEVHGTSTSATGILLALAGAAYVAGNLSSRHLVSHEPRRLLVVLAATLAATDLAFLAADCGTSIRTILFSAAALTAGSRTLVSGAYAISMPAERRAAATSLRASTMQFGYFVGSSAGGAALAAGGYRAVGVVMATLFLAAAAALLPARGTCWNRQRSAAFAKTRTEAAVSRSAKTPTTPRLSAAASGALDIRQMLCRPEPSPSRP